MGASFLAPWIAHRRGPCNGMVAAVGAVEGVEAQVQAQGEAHGGLRGDQGSGKVRSLTIDSRCDRTRTGTNGAGATNEALAPVATLRWAFGHRHSALAPSTSLRRKPSWQHPTGVGSLSVSVDRSLPTQGPRSNPATQSSGTASRFTPETTKSISE